MSDNGGAMTSEEFTEGLMRLGIEHETTLPHSPYQNGKQESFWGNLEGRLMAMLENDKNLNLQKLNQMTQIWVEREYHLNIHSETTFAPLDRFVHGKDVLRPVPETNLNLIFRRDINRTARRSDGTFSLDGKRFEIPQAYRTLSKLTVRYARWDLSQIHLVDEQGQCLTQVFPVDLKKNADGRRRLFTKPDAQMNLPLIELSGEEPPLLTKMIAEFSATGCPPTYIPMTDEEA
jgi:putative transposase